MSVVGFDVGNDNCVIAVAKQRGIDVLLNDESKRETPSMVSFGEKQRFIGLAGAESATMNPRSTISQVKRLIGRKFSEAGVQNDLKWFPFEISEGPNGGILIQLQYLNEKHSFTPVQIMAMLFAHLKQITEKNLETHVSDCVIGIPSYFTDLQRRAYLHAAQIAGLKPLRLMHDSTATALGYGIYKTDFQNGAATNVVFVDIGHCDTQVAVAAFEAGQMRILSHAFDRDLGGRDFDEILFNHFAEQFKEQYKIDVFSNTRASIRLRTACEKLKKVLSANAEAPLSIECLMDEKDVKGFIKRDYFENLSSELLERISIPCCKALLDSGLSVDKIHTIELVGSGSRVPAITKILASLFKREPSRTLNASECVARGCALQCAMLSPILRVKEYEVQDSYPFSIAFCLDEGPISMPSNGVLFPKGHPFPSMKMLTLHRNNTFHLEAFYAVQNELPSGIVPKISNCTIGPFQASQTGKQKVKVRVLLNIHGIVCVEAATLIEDKMADSTSRNNTDSEQPEVYETRTSKAIKRKEIPVSENISGGMTDTELLQAKERESQLIQQDIKIEQTKEKKNNLEAYVYETRSKLLNTYRSFASNLEREDIARNLQVTEDWLYEDGDDESENTYTQKLQDLKKMMGPIEMRYKDEDARAQAAKDLLNCIVEHQIAVGSLPTSERDVIIKECNKAEQWLREKSKQQDALPKNADPILWSSDIKEKTKDLDTVCKHILKSKSSLRRSEDRMDADQRSNRDDMHVD